MHGASWRGSELVMRDRMATTDFISTLLHGKTQAWDGASGSFDMEY